MTKKYVSPERLSQYDEKIKLTINDAISTLQNGAVKDNADAIAEIKTNMPTPISNEKIQAMFNKTEG